MLQPGILGCQTAAVTRSDTAAAVGSGTLDVFATPAMAALVEKAAWTSVSGELEPGWTTVGTALELRHLSATPVGMAVTAQTELVEVDRRRLVFSFRVFDEAGLIGEGTHQRVLVEESRFLEKAANKSAPPDPRA